MRNPLRSPWALLAAFLVLAAFLGAGLTLKPGETSPQVFLASQLRDGVFTVRLPPLQTVCFSATNWSQL